MKRNVSVTLVLLLIAAAFAAGYGLSLLRNGRSDALAGRKILYWVDPMNPAFRSDAPGTAPCGMPLEPVYEDGRATTGGAATAPGTVQVRPDRSS